MPPLPRPQSARPGLAIGIARALAAGLLALPPLSSAQNEIGFVETFALAPDRAEALKQLIPGTEDYYFFHALHAQNAGDLAAVDRFLEPWIQRHGETPRVWEIRHRQALLRYPADPQGSLAYLRERLGLSFDHQRERLNAKPDLPVALDPALISREAFRAHAFAQSSTLSLVTDAGLDHLLRDDLALEPERLRDLLGRLRHPDFPRLVGLISARLRPPFNSRFGEDPIHRLLLPDQLDALARLHPALLDDPEFIHTRLRQLQPGPDTDWTRDPAARAAYLQRLWDAVAPLNPVFNSLKAHVLYQRLQHHHRLGEYPRDLFLSYLRLPRPAGYMEPRYLADPDRQRFAVDLNADFTTVTACPPVGDDESLVRDYLLHFFLEDENWEPYAAYVREPYLKALFAEAKLTGGQGDAERWYSLLSPEAVQALKDRIDIDFAPGNPETFAPADAVSLDLFVKNAGRLLVKVYEINTLNYYLDQKRELNTDLNLDGLTANEEQVHESAEPAIRRVRRTFAFDSLAGKRGAWVVEFIGNGRSSRALVRKGRLQYLSRVTAAGVALTVLGEDNQPARKPGVWFGGREYRPAPDAPDRTILLPFSNEPGHHPIVLSDGDFASLETLELPAEAYTLAAGFHVDRETLLPGRLARLAVRPDFRINGQAAPTGLLEETKLVIRSTDHDGTESVAEVPGFKLFDDREALHEFRVPDRLARIEATLTARVKRVSAGGQPVDLAASREFALNTIDSREFIADLHLSRIGGEYVLEALGKTGEPLADRAVTVRVTHRDFTPALGFALKTNPQGRIGLTTLSDHDRIEVAGDGFPSRSWRLAEVADSNRLPASLHARAGEVIRLPFAGDPAGGPTPADLALLETRGGHYVADAFGHVSARDGLIEITGLAPGDYELFLRGPRRSVALRVTAAPAEVAGYALSAWRHLEIRNARPLQIAGLAADGDRITLRLVNAGPFTRVHLAATRFLPHYPLAALGSPNRSEPFAIRRGSAETLYLSGRDIGEEYRYILERRAAVRFPGNLAPRPALLLNPWALRDTETAIDEAAAGEAYRKKQEAAQSARGALPAPAAESPATPPAPPVLPNLDFLREPAAVYHNLVPDGNGVITLDRKQLGDRQHLHVLAVDDENAAYRTLSLPEGAGVAIRDLRLARHLDPAKHFSQRQKVTVLQAGQSLTLPDARASELETYDTLAAVHAVLAAVNGGADGAFAAFRFVLDWPTLSPERQRALYSEHACHELNLFLSRRDPGFFDAVVRPYLANKRHRTFLDDYLLGSDLSRHTQPWAWGRLNAVERILLARRIGGDEPAATARHLREQLALAPPDPERSLFFFNSALRGRAMWDTGADRAEKELREGLADAAGAAVGNRALRLADGGIETEALNKRLAAPAAAPAAAPPAPTSAPAAKARFNAPELQDKSTAAAAAGLSLGLQAADRLERLVAQREDTRALYRRLEATREWAENHYHHLPLEAQTADLITANAFWRDYAAWDGQGAFYSREFPSASRNFAEMMLALAVLDLPFTAAAHDLSIEENVLTLKAASPLIAFHEEIEESAPAADRPPILVSQNFFRASDRHTEIGGEWADKFVSGEFLTGVLYGAQVVTTNPGSSPQKLEVLLQIPRGALPALGSDYTDARHLRLDPFSTQKLEYYFYFPAPSGGEPFPHYPVHVSQDGRAVAWAEPAAFLVVDQLSTVDRAGWDYLSQHGTEEDVLAYLDRENVHRLDLGRIAWRCRESADFFRRVTSRLAARHAWNDTLWSYGLRHDDPGTARQYLLHREDFLAQCGQWLDSPLVSIDPIERRWYQHLEYQPLVNARAHRLGRERQILNDRFRDQYRAYLNTLAYRAELDAGDALGVSYYLFLQDRVEEGLAWLDRAAGNGAAAGSPLQLDYLRAYAALYRGQPAEAARIATVHAGHPVDRWRERFARIAAQVREIEAAAGAPAPADAAAGDTPESRQDALAATEPTFELKADGRTLTLDYRHLDRVRVNYYEMDLEFLFSSNPFVGEDSGRFSHIRPNVTLLKDLPAGQTNLSFPLPDQFANRNVLVEVVAAGKQRRAAVYANALAVRMVEAYGRLEVRHATTGRPLPRVYVKIYGRFGDGRVAFYKDGYTDLRGIFDYASLNTAEIDGIERFSLLILSEQDGALVREAAPPQR